MEITELNSNRKTDFPIHWFQMAWFSWIFPYATSSLTKQIFFLGCKIKFLIDLERSPLYKIGRNNVCDCSSTWREHWCKKWTTGGWKNSCLHNINLTLFYKLRPALFKLLLLFVSKIRQKEKKYKHYSKSEKHHWISSISGEQ